MRVIVYSKECPNPAPNSNADGHVHYDDGHVVPIYHESHMPESLRGGDNYFVVNGERYYPGGPE